MRLPEARIKPAILHPESEVRLTAVDYFAGSQSCDPEVMPLVIQAVEEYGRDSSFRLLRYAEHLVQTAATLDWLIDACAEVSTSRTSIQTICGLPWVWLCLPLQ